MKKRYYWIAAIIILTGGAGFAASRYILPAAAPQKELSQTPLSLSNFEPETKMEYSIFAAHGKAVTSEDVIPKDGTLNIRDEKLLALGQGAVTYNFTITPPTASREINISLTFDEKLQTIRMKGQGLEKFSGISLAHDTKTIAAKTDWAGKFERIEPFNFRKLKPGNAESFQLAFHGQDFSMGDNRKSPHIVNILFAPGGGRPPDHTWEDPPLRPNPENNIYIEGSLMRTFPEYIEVDPDGKKELLTQPPELDLETTMYFETFCGELPVSLSVCKNLEMALQIFNTVENYVGALMLMTEQLTAVMMKHIQGVGMFFDADAQIDTQREIQALVAEAHKTYHPSDQMCRFGTFVRSLASTEERINLNKTAFNKVMMTTYTGMEDRVSSEGYAVDIESRIAQFQKTYCDPADNNNGLDIFCGEGGPEERRNRDINYIETMDAPLTLKVDFTDKQLEHDEEDIFALARNLYWPRALEGVPAKELKEHYSEYIGWRNLAAVNSVAHNSFAHIMGMKSRANPESSEYQGGHFMKFLLRDLGMSGDEIEKFLGENPSYYAQMEVLTKKIYQDPDFYTNLYDKPENVKRIGVSMEAIRLMQGQDRFESSLRREMLTSLLVEQALAKHVKATNALIKSETARLR